MVFEFQGHFITGMMVGVEFPDPSLLHEDMKFCMVVDLLIIRFNFIWWKTEE